ncbi:MAG TPA: carboxypeptidase-like regulatory domain-containing protein, partial [Planctomycetota bacterium]|nr:carboxypeptidase-like regulatory domain-containing protein [Planctomycetota bacterium]
TLRRAGGVLITVKDDAGDPVPNCRIEALDADGRSVPLTTGRVAVTNARGEASLPRLPVGAITLVFRHHQTVSEATRPVTIRDGEKASLEVTLVRKALPR